MVDRVEGGGVEDGLDPRKGRHELGVDPELVQEVERRVGGEQRPGKQQSGGSGGDEERRRKEVQGRLPQSSREVVLLGGVVDRVGRPHPAVLVRETVEPVVQEVGYDEAGPPSEGLGGVREGVSDAEIVVDQSVQGLEPLQEQEAGGEDL